MYLASNKKPIKTFRDLDTWQEAHKLVLEVYKAIDKFPSKEDYALTSQVRRSVVSVTSNIAEGFSRKTSKDKIQFYRMALGSLTELQSQIITARDVGYLNYTLYKQLDERAITVHKLINGLIKSASTLKTRP